MFIVNYRKYAEHHVTLQPGAASWWGKWKHIFVTLAVKQGHWLSFMTKIFLGFFVSLFSANLQNSVLCNTIDNRQVEIFSSSLNSIHHRGMVLVSVLVCYKYNIRGKRPILWDMGGKWSFNIHLTCLSGLSVHNKRSILQMMMYDLRSGCKSDSKYGKYRIHSHFGCEHWMPDRCLCR